MARFAAARVPGQPLEEPADEPQVMEPPAAPPADEPIVKALPDFRNQPWTVARAYMAQLPEEQQRGVLTKDGWYVPSNAFGLGRRPPQ